MSRLLLFLLPALLAVGGPTLAQTITAGPDTTQVNGRPPTKKQLSAADSAARTERLFGYHVTRPTKAALLAIVPGGGQVYNKRYWKLPLVYGLLGGLGYGIYFEQTAYKEYVHALSTLEHYPIKVGERPGAVLNKDEYPRASRELTISNINTGVIFYRHYRDLFVLLSAAGFGLQVLDALVDAHLHDFDVSDDLSLHWEPAGLPVVGQGLPGLGATVVLSMK